MRHRLAAAAPAGSDLPADHDARARAQALHHGRAIVEPEEHEVVARVVFEAYRAALSAGTSRGVGRTRTGAAMAFLRRSSGAESNPRAVSSRRSRPGPRSPA